MAMSRSGTTYLERCGIVEERIQRPVHLFEGARSHYRPVRVEPVLKGPDCVAGRLRTVETTKRVAYKGCSCVC